MSDLIGLHIKTTEKHYYIRQKRKSASKGGETVRNYIGSAGLVESPRKKWNLEEVKELMTVFENELKSDAITLQLVKGKKAELETCGNVSFGQLCDKLRSLVRYSPCKRKQVILR